MQSYYMQGFKFFGVSLRTRDCTSCYNNEHNITLTAIPVSRILDHERLTIRGKVGRVFKYDRHLIR